MLLPNIKDITVVSNFFNCTNTSVLPRVFSLLKCEHFSWISCTTLKTGGTKYHLNRENFFAPPRFKRSVRISILIHVCKIIELGF